MTLEGADAVRPASDNRAPQWFTTLVLPNAAVTRVETPRGAAIIIAANPADEIAEIWQEIIWLAIGGAGIAAAAFALVSLAVSRTLRPVATLADGLSRLERGDHSMRVPGDGSPEFVVIAERINTLAATLQRLDDENHRLVRRMIHVQDEERRDIARDLHDEIGPFLFTVRAGVGALARKAAAPSADPMRLAEDCARIDAQIAALQQVNRRILGRLRPAALEEMGLADAIEALAQGWRERIRRSRSLFLSTAPWRDRGRNCAHRLSHRAGRIDQRLSPFGRGSRRGERHTRNCELRIDVRDNGSGLDAATGPSAGLGLRGMSERVGALGGSLTLVNDPDGGVYLTASLPRLRKERKLGVRVGKYSRQCGITSIVFRYFSEL